MCGCCAAFAEYGTLSLLGAGFDTAGVGERELTSRLSGRFAAGMLVLADRGFPSFELWREAAATSAGLAWRCRAAFALPLIERLPDGTYLSQLRGRRKYERTRVRVVEFSVKDADTGISEVFALITTLLDPEAHNAEQLARLYAERWRADVGHRWYRSSCFAFSWLCSLFLAGFLFWLCPAGAGVEAGRAGPALA